MPKGTLTVIFAFALTRPVWRSLLWRIKSHSTWRYRKEERFVCRTPRGTSW
jgi:hypothetical protein